MSPLRVAVCADDFGLDAHVNRGVMALAERGRLNGVGCMVGAPGWGGASAELAALDAAGVDIGLHLDLTEHPLDARWRINLPALIARSYLHRLPITALRAEIGQQIDRFEQRLGRSPDYIDGHRHVHQLPQVRNALLDLLAERRCRPWLRSTRHAPGLRAPAGSAVAERIKPRLIVALGANALARDAARAGLAQNRRLLGVYAFGADEAAYQRWVEVWLAAAGDLDVLMCHPALGAASGADDPIATARAVEQRVLDSAWMDELLERHDVRRVRLSGVLGAPSAA